MGKVGSQRTEDSGDGAQKMTGEGWQAGSLPHGSRGNLSRRGSRGGRKLQERKRRLPHHEQPGATDYITFTRAPGAHVDLTDAPIARIIVGAMRYFAGIRYHLYDYTVMPDHVHVILKPMFCSGSWESLSDIMHSIKSWTANQINRRLGRSGSLWLDESYDHMLRGQKDHEVKARYIWLNAARAGLIDDPPEWPWWGRGDAEHEGL